MRCYLVRHAQTIWNHENRIQGHADPPLSPQGREQVKCLGAYFATLATTGSPIGTLYTSNLKRSVQTAQAIAEQTGVSVRIEPALAEIHLGIWEGLTPEEVDARFDGAYQTWRLTPSQVRIPGAEPLDQFRARVRKALASIAANHHEGAIVIVSHGGVIAALLADWLGADYDHLLHRLVLDNAGISALDYRTNPVPILPSLDDGSQRAASPKRSPRRHRDDIAKWYGANPPHVLWINATSHLGKQ